MGLAYVRVGVLFFSQSKSTTSKQRFLREDSFTRRRACTFGIHHYILNQRTTFGLRVINMVDFGLKLEDNKVSEWTDNYIDYEALKKILKAASAEIKRRDDLMRRKPQVAEAVLAQYREGNPTPHPSQTDLQKIASGEGGDQVSAESKPLLQQTNEKYGSKDSVAAAAVSEARSDSVLSNTIRRTMSGYFMEGNYEHRIRESLKEIDKLEGKFDECVHGEVRS